MHNLTLICIYLHPHVSEFPSPFCSALLILPSTGYATFHSHLCYFFPPQGHLLLIGVSGAGKTTLSRFVAWMNGLKVFQVKVCLLRLEFFLVDSWFCFNFPCDWSRKLMPPFQPIRGNTETNWGLVARVFPRLRWFVFITSSHWSLVTFSLVLIGRCDYLSFGFWSQTTSSLWAPLEVSSR